VSARAKRWANISGILWILSSIAGLVLTHSVHAGPFLYYLFLALAWPFIYFADEPNWASFALSTSLQLIYVAAVVAVLLSAPRRLR
jgi:uncharacterized membrane protein